MLRQTFKKMVKEIYHDNISSVATQMTEYRRRPIRLRHEKNVTSQMRQREIMCYKVSGPDRETKSRQVMLT